MCPKHPPAPHRQRGFLLPLALFIVVVMGLSALVLTQLSSQQSHTRLLEFMNVQAFYAAESGAGRGMQTLFFPDATSRQAIDTRCTTLNSTITYTGVSGLSPCQVVVTCSCLYGNNAACAPGTAANYLPSSSQLTSYYRINSQASCGTGLHLARRQLEWGAYADQE
jgi:MSHA biogenesis protein MshP